MSIARDSLNLPNAVTVARLVLSVLLFALIEAGQDGIWLAGLFVFAVATDVVDGWIARTWNLVTPLGRILDPFADKFIVCGTMFFLLPREAGVTTWMVTIVVGREMFVSALRGYLEAEGIDFSADWSGKIKTFVQCVGVTAALLGLSPAFQTTSFLQLRDVLLWTVVAVTLYSWVAYVVRGFRGLATQTENGTPP